MAVKPQTSTKREPYPPIPMGMHPGVLVDVYYSENVEGTWEGITSLKDYVNLAVEFDTTVVPERDIQGIVRPSWLANRWAVSMERKANALWAETVHKTIKLKSGEVKDYGLYKEGDVVYSGNYQDCYLRNSDYELPVELDDNDEPNLFIGPRHGIYKLLAGWGGDDFIAAWQSGDVSFEGLVGKNAQFLITNGKPAASGQIYSKIKEMAPPTEGQALVPSEHYVRIKERVQEVAEIPF